jgi:hypothetical protein
VDRAFCEGKTKEISNVAQRCISQVRNTQKQYARVAVPEDSEIWSSMVDGLPIKPARCLETNQVMLPLSKSSGSAGQPSAFQVCCVCVRMCVWVEFFFFWHSVHFDVHAHAGGVAVGAPGTFWASDES